MGGDKMTREQQIENFMKKLDLTRAEAIELLGDDENDFIGEQGEEMTKKAKEIKRYEKADKPRAKTQKERKIDYEKQSLLNLIDKGLRETVLDRQRKTETEISFKYGGNAYTVKLIKHRSPK